MRYACRTMTRNVDSSKCSPRSAIFYISCKRAQLLTKRGANRILSQHELEGHVDRARVESVVRDQRVVYNNWRLDEDDKAGDYDPAKVSLSP